MAIRPLPCMACREARGNKRIIPAHNIPLGAPSPATFAIGFTINYFLPQVKRIAALDPCFPLKIRLILSEFGGSVRDGGQ